MGPALFGCEQSKFPVKLKRYRNHTPVSHVLICRIFIQNLETLKEFYLAFLFRIKREAPVCTSHCLLCMKSSRSISDQYTSPVARDCSMHPQCTHDRTRTGSADPSSPDGRRKHISESRSINLAKVTQSEDNYCVIARTMHSDIRATVHACAARIQRVVT